MSFQPGDRIEAQFQGGQQWYAGTISGKTATGYDVDYDDGDKEQNVAVTLIRSQVSEAVKALQDNGCVVVEIQIGCERAGLVEGSQAITSVSAERGA